MRIEIAGVSAEVVCRNEENEAFFREYRTERAPMLTLAPSDAELARMREKLTLAAERGDVPYTRFSEAFVENSALHEALAEALTAYGVLLMHGSALCMDGRAYIFTAPSGTGKSTHARLWREAFGDRVWMINDDKPLLRLTEEGAWVCGSPWDGKHHLSKNASAPLKAIARVRRSDRSRVEPMPRAEAFRCLYAQCYASRDPAVMQRILAMERRLLDTAAFYDLACSMEPEAALAAWEGLRGGDI